MPDSDFSTVVRRFVDESGHPFTVVAERIGGTLLVEVTAWEPEDGHWSIRPDGEGGVLGQVGTAPLPDDRKARERAWAVACDRARTLIAAAFPHAAADGGWDGGSLLTSVRRLRPDLTAAEAPSAEVVS